MNYVRERDVVHGQYNLVCPLCFHEEETTLHLFMRCKISSLIWSTKLDWMDLSGVPLFVSIVDNFILFDYSNIGRIKKRYRGLLWFVATWSLWISQNVILFKGDYLVINNVLSLVKSLSWDWFEISCLSNVEMTYEDRCLNYILCIQRVGEV